MPAAKLARALVLPQVGLESRAAMRVSGEELACPARYLSSFTVDRRYAGHGIGARLGD